MPNHKNSDIERLGRLLTSVYESGYLSKRRLYSLSLVKGILIGFGGALGASLGVALLAWILSWFDQAPIVGPLFDSLRHEVEQVRN
jgi:hypothetical protein